ncbi:MAG: HEAT repeat domain-containing protein [Candidatus Hydrothermarchaeaceae archaeon]
MALFRSKESPLERFLSQLKDPSPEVRRRAAYELSNLGDDRAIPHLIEALSDADKRVRWRVAYALGDLGEMGLRSDDAYEALVSHLEAEEDWNVRRIIVMSFRHWDERAVKPLINALDDESKYVRRYAAMTIGLKKSKDAVGRLERLIETEESKMVRDYAKWALGEINKS